MKRFLTKRYVLLALTIVFFLIAWNREINLLYGMSALLSGTLIISHFLPRYSLSGITAARYLQPTAFEGDDIDIKVYIQNTGWKSRYMIEVRDYIPAAEPRLIPGMDSPQHPMLFVSKLSGREKKEYSFNAVCYKRGVYNIGPITLRSAYPLGISSVERSMNGYISNLVVYPKIFDIATLPLIAGACMPMIGIEAVSKAGGSEEFFGTREYREGDSLKYIHWPSTARHSQLIVKEFEIRASTEITLILDLHKGSCFGKGKETTLEYAVKIAASIGKYSLDKGHNLQLICYGEKPHIVPSARGIGQLAMIFDELARVEADGDLPYHEAILQAAGLIRDGGTAILIFSQSDPDIKNYLFSLGILKAKRIRTVCFFIDNRSFSDKENFRPPYPEGNRLINWFLGECSPVYFISRGDNLREIFSV